MVPSGTPRTHLSSAVQSPRSRGHSCGSSTYTKYRMTFSFGEFGPSLTKAINRVAKDSSCVKFLRHARSAMDDDDFDDADVLECLRRGKAHGPEEHKGELRANVLHRGRHIRVAVALSREAADDWTLLTALTVVTVMRTS